MKFSANGSVPLKNFDKGWIVIKKHALGVIGLFILSACSEEKVRSLEIEPNPQALPNSSLTKAKNSHGRLPLPSIEVIEQLPSDGGTEFNRLIFESSPYLLQHARNPINWYPWGAEAFAAARESNKPVFLSIGYTTCHWCHVMEHESFEDQEVANLINEHYICIKVDREERPDVDNIYMSVTQMMTGRGGWPMTVIMSPEKIPFFAGTYFPKSSMLQLLPHFAKVWKEDREKTKEVGAAILMSLKEMQTGRAGGDLNATHLQACLASLSQNFDEKNGGFGDHPKFPTCHTLSLLLRIHHFTGNPQALAMVEKTLRAIRLGGIYDQVGKGIHRYSTDAEWLVPHFEKMLYDQALFAIANLECYQVTQDRFFLDACRDTLDYVARDLTDGQGGFYSAEDADSEGEEGKFYLWTKAALEDVLGKEDAIFFSKIYGFVSEGNYLDEVTREKTGSNIPHLSQTFKKTAKELGIPTSSLQKKVNLLRKKLFEGRKKRIHPQKDDKVLTDWNGLMISAFARAGRVLADPEYIQAASKAANFCIDQLTAEDGRLLKRWRLGKAGLPAHLEDYAFLGQGLLDLYEASSQTRYLKKAKEIIDSARVHFEDDQHGGFFLTADDGELLLIRSKEIYDGAIPSGNSVMGLNLLRLAKFTGNQEYQDSAHALFSAFSGFLSKNPQGAEVLLSALHFELAGAMEIVVCGNPEHSETQLLLDEINQRFIPAKVIIYKTTENDAEISKLSPFVKNHKVIQGKATVYLCQNQTCQKPESNPVDLARQMEQILKWN